MEKHLKLQVKFVNECAKLRMVIDEYVLAIEKAEKNNTQIFTANPYVSELHKLQEQIQSTEDEFRSIM